MFLSFIHSFVGLLKLVLKNQSLLLTFYYILDCRFSVTTEIFVIFTKLVHLSNIFCEIHFNSRELQYNIILYTDKNHLHV